MKMRLDRFVSQASGLSRTDARRQIRRGRVSLAGSVVKQLALPVSSDMPLTLDGMPLGIPGPLYLMLNKPAGLVCSTRDDHSSTVMSLLPEKLIPRLHIVGRLDKDTTGLLLLTDDGAWSHQITAPRRHCAKVYRAELASPLSEEAITHLRQGVMLRNEKQKTKPALIEPGGRQEVLISITEGRYHQVKRMFAAVGNRVTGLHRERIGGLQLDPLLGQGGWRDLTELERRLVLNELK